VKLKVKVNVSGADVPVALSEDVLEALVVLNHQAAPWHDADVLEKVFVDEGLTDEVIAAELGCGRETVQKWRKRYGIKVTPGPRPARGRREST